MKERNLQYWIDLVFRRRAVFSRVAMVVFGLIFLGTVLWPPTYQATSKILIQANRAQLLVSPGLQENNNQPTVLANPISEQELNSEIELLTSQSLVEAALSGLPEPKAHSGLSAALLRTMSLPGSGYRA